MEGADFEVDWDLLPHYLKPPYVNIYDTMLILVMAITENVRLLLIGKVLPTRWIPWIENHTTAIVKVAPLKLTGMKWRTCVDMTASGVNGAVEK